MDGLPEEQRALQRSSTSRIREREMGYFCINISHHISLEFSDRVISEALQASSFLRPKYAKLADLNLIIFVVMACRSRVVVDCPTPQLSNWPAGKRMHRR